MKKIISHLTLMLLLMAATCSTAMAQRYHRPYSYRSHSSSYGRAMRGLHAVETAADYVMLGSMLNGIDDYTGLRLGFNSASLRASGFDDATTDNIPAVNLGIVFGWYLGRQSALSIEPGFFYSMKGGKLSEHIGQSGSHGSFSTTKFTTHSFELPVVLKAHLPIAPAVNIEPFAGAFMAFGFGGTTTLPDGEKYDTYDDRYLEDFDAGFRLGVGLSAGNAYFEAAYDLGLVNLCDRYEFDRHEALRSSTWSFNIGINF